MTSDDEPLRLGRPPRWRDALALLLAAAGAGWWFFTVGRRAADLEAWLLPFGVGGPASVKGAVLALRWLPLVVVTGLLWRLARSAELAVTEEWVAVRVFPGRLGRWVVSAVQVTDRAAGDGWLRVRAPGFPPARVPCQPERVEPILARLDAWRGQPEAERPVFVGGPPRLRLLMAAVLAVTLAEVTVPLVLRAWARELGGSVATAVSLVALSGLLVYLAGLPATFLAWFGRLQVGRGWLVVGDLTCRWREVDEVVVADGHVAARSGGARAVVRLPPGAEEEARRLLGLRLEAHGVLDRLGAKLPGWARAPRRALRAAATLLAVPLLGLMAAALVRWGPDARVACFHDTRGQAAYVVTYGGAATPTAIVVDTRRGPAGRVAIVTSGPWSRTWTLLDSEVPAADVVDLASGEVRLAGADPVALPPGTTFVHLSGAGLLTAAEPWHAPVGNAGRLERTEAARRWLGPGRDSRGTLPIGPARAPLLPLPAWSSVPLLLDAWSPASHGQALNDVLTGWTSATVLVRRDRSGPGFLVVALDRGRVTAVVVDERPGRVHVERPDLDWGIAAAPVVTHEPFVAVSPGGAVRAVRSPLPPPEVVFEGLRLLTTGEPIAGVADLVYGGAETEELAPGGP